MANKTITVSTLVNAPIETVWRCWNTPEDIIVWAHASDDWEAPAADNDLRVGGRFKTTMAAKDKSVSFDFTGTYTVVIPHERIEYAADDGRIVVIVFETQGSQTKVTETFEMENVNPEEMQRGGWQAILDNFKKHAESQR